MLKGQDYTQLLERLFNPSEESLRIDLEVLREICLSSDYHTLIDLSSILTRLFLASKQRISISELIGRNVGSDHNHHQQKV
jgi:hypothetical protein